MTAILRKLHVWFGTRRPRSEDGASLVEYALLIGLIAIVCFVAVQFLGDETSSSIDGAGSSFSTP